MRQADQARPWISAIQLELKGIQAPTARLPTRRDLAKAALGILFGAAALVMLWAEAVGICNQPISAKSSSTTKRAG
jgi:hypothetical protein